MKLLKNTLAGLCLLLAMGHSAADELTVVTSFSILENLVKVVGADKVSVTPLITGSTNPHSFQFSSSHARKLKKADLLVVNGLQFESWLLMLDRSGVFSGTTLVSSRGVNTLHWSHKNHTDHGEDHVDAPASINPHAWLSLRNLKVYVNNIRDELTRLQPHNADLFHRNANAYTEELDALDRSMRDKLQQIPPSSRQVVVSHDAFAYLARDYDIAFYPVYAGSSEFGGSASRLARTMELIRDNEIQLLYSEELVDPRPLRQLESETDARIAGHLFVETYGQTGSVLGMMRHNLDTLLSGLSSLTP